MELISLIVPVFNLENYLNKCIGSIISQTYKKLEIIIVDDGSTDQSGQICDSWAERDRRIRVIHDNNRGLVVARKRGLAIAHGKYIGFVDADDYIEQDFVGAMFERIVETQSDFVDCGIMIGSKPVNIHQRESINLEQDRKHYVDLFCQQRSNSLWMAHSLCSKLFRHNVIRKGYMEVPDDASCAEDSTCTLACLMFCKRIAFVDRALYHMTERSGSISRSGIKSRIYNCARTYIEYDHILKKTFPDLCEKTESTCFEEMLSVIKSFDDKGRLQQFVPSRINELQGKRIVLYGAGRVGVDYYTELSRIKDIHIITWIDKNNSRYDYRFSEVQPIDVIEYLEFDVILIAVADKRLFEEIKKELVYNRVDAEKVLWISPRYL